MVLSKVGRQAHFGSAQPWPVSNCTQGCQLWPGDFEGIMAKEHWYNPSTYEEGYFCFASTRGDPGTKASQSCPEVFAGGSLHTCSRAEGCHH